MQAEPKDDGAEQPLSLPLGGRPLLDGSLNINDIIKALDATLHSLPEADRDEILRRAEEALHY